MSEIEQILDRITDQPKLTGPFVLFEAGHFGRETLKLLRANGIKPLAFSDNDVNKWGTNVDGLTVYSPELLPHFFQNGPLKETGVNGVSAEALLAIVEHRLTCFQAGPYACRENAIAFTKLQEAMHWLHHRTRERIARNVEGTMQK